MSDPSFLRIAEIMEKIRSLEKTRHSLCIGKFRFIPEVNKREELIKISSKLDDLIAELKILEENECPPRTNPCRRATG